MEKIKSNNVSQDTICKLEKVYNLPALSTVMMQVSQLLSDPNTTTADLSEVIGKDQGLSSKVLTIANSPLYGLPRKVSTIDFAIMIIGFQDVKNIVVALSMIDAFKSPEQKDFDQRKFWLHSLITGSASKRISDDLGYRIGPEAFVAGLLHDLGIAVIGKFFPEKFGRILEIVKLDSVSFEEAEREILGLTHYEIGYFLADNWNLPIRLCNVIRTHHAPYKNSDDEIIAAIVHLADFMTHYLEIGDFNWDADLDFDPTIIKTLKFSSVKDLFNFVDGYAELFKQEINALRI